MFRNVKREACQSSASFAAELEVAHKTHSKTTAVLGNIAVGMTCPQCLKLIDESNIDDVKSGFSKKLTEVVSQGKSLQTQLKELNLLDKKAKEMFDQFQNEYLQKHQKELTIIREGKIKYIADFQAENALYEQNLKDMKSQVQTLNEQLLTGNLSAAEHSELVELEQLKATKNAEYEAIKAIYRQNDVVGLDEKIKAAGEQVKSKNQLV